MVDAANPGVGVLIDLDLAARVDTLRESSEHAGTLPFMAIDLLPESPPIKRYYRHDLESFFWVIVWAVVGQAQGHAHPAVEYVRWYTGS